MFRMYYKYLLNFYDKVFPCLIYTIVWRNSVTTSFEWFILDFFGDETCV